MIKLRKALFVSLFILGVSAVNSFSINDRLDNSKVVNNYMASKYESSQIVDNTKANTEEGETYTSNISFKKYGQVVNVDSSLNLRNEPSVNSTTNDTLYNGMTFDIINKEDGWYKIKHNNAVGFVKADYVEEYNDMPPNKEVKEKVESQNSNNNQVNEKTKTLSAKENKKQNQIGTPIKAELTAYCNDEESSGKWGSKTAMETETRLGVVAAPTNIPLGSKLYIPGLSNYKSDGIFNVEDRGGAIKVKADGTYIIDIWLPTREEAEAFGRQQTTIYLVK